MANLPKATIEDFDIVKNIQDTITISKMRISKMVDPFSATASQNDLLNISTCEKCTSTDLVNVRQIGLDALRGAESNNSEKVNIPKIKTFISKKTKKSTSTTLTRILPR